MNLIGEHIDYNGLSVLPMALRQAVTLAVRPRTDAIVRVRNADGAFGEQSFPLSNEIPAGPQGDWGNYLRAAAQALSRVHGAGRGLDAWLTSDVPVAAGLSSSSALVCAVGLALSAVNDLELPVLELAGLMARAERYVGTMGGGMDQAIALGAVEGAACRVDFDPLALTPVPVPDDWRFIVGSSLVVAEKSGSARETYNRRREECGLALERAVALLDLPPRQWADPGIVGEQSRGAAARHRGWRYRELLEAVPLDGLLDEAERLPAPLDRRFRHVVTEAHRVREAEAALSAADSARFGGLMVQSHSSLRDDYEVSHPSLDALVGIARDAGAVGARLTGAGFGGCVVALASEATAGAVISAWDEEFYGPAGVRPPGAGVRFAASAGPGASVRRL